MKEEREKAKSKARPPRFNFIWFMASTLSQKNTYYSQDTREGPERVISDTDVLACEQAPIFISSRQVPIT